MLPQCTLKYFTIDSCSRFLDKRKSPIFLKFFRTPSDLKLVCVLALDGCVERLDGGHVGLHIARKLEQRTQAADLALVVHKRQHDGHARLLGDEIKACLPGPCLAA